MQTTSFVGPIPAFSLVSREDGPDCHFSLFDPGDSRGDRVGSLSGFAGLTLACNRSHSSVNIV